MKLYLHYPMFRDQQEHGHLTNNKLSHACWYFYMLAEKLRITAGTSTEDQIILEGQAWMDKPYGQLARSVATLYQLDSPAEFLHPYWKNIVEEEARRLDMPAPHPEYWSNKIGPDTILIV